MIGIRISRSKDQELYINTFSMIIMKYEVRTTAVSWVEGKGGERGDRGRVIE